MKKVTYLECARKYLGYTQIEIAELCHMTRQRYSALEKGDKGLRFNEVSLVFHTIKSLELNYKHPFSWTYDVPYGFNQNHVNNMHLENMLDFIKIE